ncbi:MAG TPA: Stp1/IreP family PP2C-type Ser/Thr phosphatase [Desulfitobacteriaceae bacterium]|jgi:protein phosphatase|nr:Stp1/IreP family PP2C-type Ser/Thr phosphatase [Desulfitobacteriaceae bacterium]
MRVLSFSETGQVRKNNEDAFLVLSGCGLFAVADGMGGHKAGEIASATAIREIEKLAVELQEIANDKLEPWLKEAIAQANNVIYETAVLYPENQGMGTTLTMLVLRQTRGFVAHIGDSRAYLWRDGGLLRLTDDHSLAEELVRMGQITVEEAEKHPQKHVLMRALGTSRNIEIDYRTCDLRPGDVFLLCTDGLSNLVSDEELAEKFRRPESWEDRFERLKVLVLERGAPDNFTALCCIME